MVFVEDSGESHHLNLVEREALAAFRVDVPLAPAEWKRAVAQRLEIELDQDLSDYLEQLIVQFDELGFIEPVRQ